DPVRVAAGRSEPGANRKATHAVADQRHARLSGSGTQGTGGGLDLSGIVVDSAKRRLEVHRRHAVTLPRQSARQGAPDGAIAEIDVNRHDWKATRVATARQLLLAEPRHQQDEAA